MQPALAAIKWKHLSTVTKYKYRSQSSPRSKMTHKKITKLFSLADQKASFIPRTIQFNSTQLRKQKTQYVKPKDRLTQKSRNDSRLIIKAIQFSWWWNHNSIESRTQYVTPNSDSLINNAEQLLHTIGKMKLPSWSDWGYVTRKP